MRNEYVQLVKRYSRRNSRRKAWKNFVRIMAYVVVFCTTYALILPVLTMEHRNTCGLEEHTHSQACYEEVTHTVITCDPLHSHTDACYGENGEIVCGLFDTLIHTHDDRCRDGEGALVCSLPEYAGHIHEEACYSTVGHAHQDSCYSEEAELVCGQEEAPVETVLACTLPEDMSQAHQHTDECLQTSVEEVMTCTLEEHTHTLACQSDPEADLETEEDWQKTMKSVKLTGVWAEDLVAIAKSQVGYSESEKNYLTEDGETKHGYSRYGAWYGVPYGSWDAMFVSFCLNYAGIPKEALPHAADPAEWAAELGYLELLEPVASGTPQPGDLLFFADEFGAVTGVEIVTGLEMETDGSGEKYVSEIKTIGGDREDEVSRGSYDAKDPSLYVSCRMDAALARFLEHYPEDAKALGLLTEETVLPQKQTQTAETDNYIVTVTYPADLEMPDGTEFRVTEYARDSEIFRQRCEEAGYELEWLLNIGFFLGDEELELDGSFDVVVTSKQGDALGSDITHFAENGAERIEGENASADAEDGQSSVSFSADGFSDFGGGVAPLALHTHSWQASGVTRPTCTSLGSVVKYTCSCGQSFTVDPTSLANKVQAYADYLRTTNDGKTDYSTGMFTWDTEGKTKTWTYYNGVMLDAFMRVGSDEMVAYVTAVYDDMLDVDGYQYRAGEVDSVPMALALFDLLGSNDAAMNEEYVTAIQYVFNQLWNEQTVLGSDYGGNYWHKEVNSSNNWYTWRFSLDGIYMALPFLMEYANALDEGLLTNNTVTSAQIYSTVFSRLNWVANNMYDQTTGLYHHGWNGKEGNGQFWGRGIGWYAVALVDIIDMMPSGYRGQLTSNLTKLFDGMLRWQDADTGMWYNLVNYDSSLINTTSGNSNLLETSVSSMMAYSMMKAYREGWVDAKYYEAGLRALNGVVTNKMTGTTSVSGTYRNAGVSTIATDYLKNPYTTDEAKGVGALIMAAAPEHNWSDWTVGSSKARAVTTDTTESRECEDCGEIQSRAVTVAAEAVEEVVTGYTFTVLDPTKLTNGQIVAIYCRLDGNGDDFAFIYSDTLSANAVMDTGKYYSPINYGNTWDATADQMGRSAAAFTWEVVKGSDGVVQLRLLGAASDDTYLRMNAKSGLYSGSGVGNDNNKLSVQANTQNGNAGSIVKHATKANVNLYYDSSSNTWKAGSSSTIVYFASVEVKTETVVAATYPVAVQTGAPEVNNLRFYNFVEIGNEKVGPLPGCTFVIKGADAANSGYSYTIVSGSTPELYLPSDIPVGNYTIEEVSAPDGYLRDVNPVRSFGITVDGDGRKIFVGSNTIGKYLNHKIDLLDADKVAEVEDYNNRTYQIMLTAESNLRLYEMNPVDVIFVVDQSNSMLFPAGLVDTGARVTLQLNKDVTKEKDADGDSTNSDALNALVSQGKLSKSKLYYIIADPNVRSTVYAVWWNGTDWMYQDASYYAKAYYENAKGYRQDDEFAVFPQVTSLTEQPATGDVTYIDSYDANGNPIRKTVTATAIKANGGSFSYLIGHHLGEDLAADADNKMEFVIYTAYDQYNRLHYLQDALANSIHQLAEANSDSTVTLIRFNKETLHEQCVGPWKLSPDNVLRLTNEVENIETDGGTRQDIALEHAYMHLTGQVTWEDENGVAHTEDAYTKGVNNTFTVLITDGAPVTSGGTLLNLGTPSDAKPTDATVKSMTTTGDNIRAANQAKGLTIYSCIKYWGDKVGIRTTSLTNGTADGESVLMTIGLGMGAVDGGADALGQIATDGKTGGYHLILDNAAELMQMLRQLLFSSMKPREKVDLMADINDVISDSFYPIAWVEEGKAPSNRDLLVMKDPQDTQKDWIILEPGDWITCEGQYVGPKQTNGDLYGTGQLQELENGDYQIYWDDQMLYDCELVWVPTLAEVPSGRRVVMTEEHVRVGNTTSTYGRYWFRMEIGDQVYAHGEYVNPRNPKSGTVPYEFVKDGMTYQIIGKYVYSSGDDRAHIQWDDYYAVDFDANFQPFVWHGKFYVKAKEDFIGGNAIDTNKSAKVDAQQNDGDVIDEWLGAITLETPTVNVRLLDMNRMETEVTVYLGDIINSGLTDDPLSSPLDSVQDFYWKTFIEKLHADFEDKALVMNKVDTAIEGDGLETDKFYLQYAMGADLTADQWATLAAGGTVTVEYTYDNPSSHGAVGYFTFRLTKDGDTADYEAHEATADCQMQHTHDARCTDPVETYTLHVTYTAYKLGEEGRPESTVHNDTADIDGDRKDAGTEVGGANAGSTLPTGLGVVDKDDVHQVHVISGAVLVVKEIAENMVSDEDQIFEFTLHRTEDGEDTANDRTLTVTVKAGQTSGQATTEHLQRGTWVLTENVSAAYSLKEITVIEMLDEQRITNCAFDAETGRVTFHMGLDYQDRENVIGKASDEAAYTSYTGTPNGVYGAAKAVNQKPVYNGQVPVEKIWFDGNDGHAKDTVLLVLYDNDVPVQVDGRVQYLYLNADTGWKGTFTVYLDGVEDSVDKHSYSVREAVVTDLTAEEYEILHEDAKAGYIPLILVDGDKETLVYAKAAAHESILADGRNAWFVRYGTKTETIDGKDQTVHTVTNSPARVLPESGGVGTEMYTIGGLLCIAAALMYGYSQRRKRERRAVE